MLSVHRLGTAWLGRQGEAWRGMARRGESRQARQAGHGTAGRVESRWGMAGNGRHIKETTMLIAKIAIVVMCLFSALCWIVTYSALRSK